ncbi:MAG: SH3 domain-containing protein, partial [Thermomicrobiales bacterium]|nr:SH3 domain-containing protein [Thermomicrobiales bacterium]
KNDVIRSHLEHDPDPPSVVRPLPAWVDDAVMLALAKRPKDRYRDCASFARVFWTGIDVPEGVVDAGNTTARVWTPPTVDTEIEQVQPRRSGPGRQVAGGLYRTGGRLARHTRWLQRIMWRAVIALLVGNVLLAGLLYADRGEVPGLIAGGAELSSGATARVTTDRLRLRSEPGRDSEVIGLLALEEEVRVIGSSEERDGETWWPVRATLEGQTVEGYVSGGWLEPVGGPGKVWLQRGLDELRKIPGWLLDEVGIGIIEAER